MSINYDYKNGGIKMSKNVKRIIAMILAIGTISFIAPAANVNLLTTKVYADESKDTTLSSLQLKDSSGSVIKLYSVSNYNSDSRLDENDIPQTNETYYAKTSKNSVKVSISGTDNKYVKVFKGESDNIIGKNLTSGINISSDTTLTVRVYDGDPGSDVQYDDDNDKANIESEYKIEIEYKKDDSTSEDPYDPIYLQELAVNGESISLSKSNTKYSYNVDSNIDQVIIKAKAEDEDNKVSIGGQVLSRNGNYRTTVSLNSGKNEFEVKLLGPIFRK